MSTPKRALAIIAGAGPGTGTSVALRFAKLYDIILLTRSEASFRPALDAITNAGGSAHGIPTDISSSASVAAAFQEIGEKFPGAEVRAGIYNVGGKFAFKPFLEITEEEWAVGTEVPLRGAYNFAHHVLPHLVSAVPTTNATSDTDPKYPPTLIFTGATASVKASAKFSSFAASKWGTRALSQSLAKEFAPQGVHVAHAVIDGVIDIEATKAYKMADKGPESKISPDAIAEAYWFLHTQPKSAFTWEVDIRPFVETW